MSLAGLPFYGISLHWSALALPLEANFINLLREWSKGGLAYQIVVSQRI